jgi:hypothetical protein
MRQIGRVLKRVPWKKVAKVAAATAGIPLGLEFSGANEVIVAPDEDWISLAILLLEGLLSMLAAIKGVQEKKKEHTA